MYLIGMDENIPSAFFKYITRRRLWMFSNANRKRNFQYFRHYPIELIRNIVIHLSKQMGSALTDSYHIFWGVGETEIGSDIIIFRLLKSEEFISSIMSPFLLEFELSQKLCRYVIYYLMKKIAFRIFPCLICWRWNGRNDFWTWILMK